MNTKISVILLFISLALLIIYGADVISSQATSNDGKSGFLQLSAAIRGSFWWGRCDFIHHRFCNFAKRKIYIGSGTSPN